MTPFIAAAALIVVAFGPSLLRAGDGPYVLYDGQRYPQHAAGSFYSCHELAHPEIRCFDSTEAMKGDVLMNFPSKAQAAEELMPDITPIFEGP
jgi:hypothetical protein